MWGGRFALGPSEALDALNRSLPVDHRLWPQDVFERFDHMFEDWLRAAPWRTAAPTEPGWLRTQAIRVDQYRDGEISLETAVPLAAGQLTPQVLDHAIGAMVSTYKEYHPKIAALKYGSLPTEEDTPAVRF